jgi:hypothetical protein
MGDRPQLAGEFGGGDDVDTRGAQQQHVQRLDQECSQLPLHRGDLPDLGRAIVLEGGPDALEGLGMLGAAGRRLGPGQERVEAGGLELYAGLLQDPAQSAPARVPHRRGRTRVSGDQQCDFTDEEISKTVGVTGHEDFEVSSDLAQQDDGLADQVAAMSGQEPELVVGGVEGPLAQAEAIDGRTMDSGQVGVIGLVAGVGRLAELFGGERVDDPDLEAGSGEGALGREVVAPSPLDGNDEVPELLVVDGPSAGGAGRPRSHSWCARSLLVE